MVGALVFEAEAIHKSMDGNEVERSRQPQRIGNWQFLFQSIKHP